MFQESRLYLNYLLQFKHFATYCCLSAMGTNKLNGFLVKKIFLLKLELQDRQFHLCQRNMTIFLLEKPNQPYIKLICNL